LAGDEIVPMIVRHSADQGVRELAVGADGRFVVAYLSAYRATAMRAFFVQNGISPVAGQRWEGAISNGRPRLFRRRQRRDGS
jgi:hypothetical protein